MLTSGYETYEKPSLVVAYKIAQGEKVFRGAMVGLNDQGYAGPLTKGGFSRFVGISNETADNTDGGDGDKSFNVAKSGSFVMGAVKGHSEDDSPFSPAIGMMGCVAHAVSDWETSVSHLCYGPTVGNVVGIETTSTGVPGFRVRITGHTV